MKIRLIAWLVAFALPVAGAAGRLFSLRQERLRLQIEIAGQTLTATESAAAQRSAARLRQELAEKKTLAGAKLDETVAALAPAQPGAVGAFLALVRPDTEKAAASRAEKSVRIPVFATGDQPYFPQLLHDADYARAVGALIRQGVETKYGRLFARLNLSPVDQDRLETLLTQREMARLDADGLLGPGTGAAGRSAGKAAVVSEINRDIRTGLGGGIAQAIGSYDGEAQIYGFTDELETRLSYTAAPLQPGQAEQLAAILQQAMGRVLTQYWEVPDEAVARSAGILSPPQVAVLQRMQEERQVRLRTRNPAPSD